MSLTAKTYRRRVKSDVWHWIPECRWWPRGWSKHGTIIERDRKPKSGELCNECRAKAKRK